MAKQTSPPGALRLRHVAAAMAAGVWLTGGGVSSHALAQDISFSGPAFRAADYGDYMSAQLAWEQGDYATAARRLAALAERNPEEPSWVESAVSAYLAAGDPEAALRLAQWQERIDADALAGVARLSLAADALRLRRWREAEELLASMPVDDEQTATHRLAAGVLRVWAQAGRGDEEGALELLLTLPRPRAMAATLPFQRAMILEGARRFSDADGAYAEAAAGQRLLVEDVLRYAAYLERRQGRAGAAAYLEGLRGRIGNIAFEAALAGRYQAPAPAPHRNAALGLVGYGRGLAGEDAAFDAALALSLALLVDPEQQGGRMALAVQLRAMGQNDRALAVASAVGPSSVYFEAAQVEVAELMAEEGRTDEALALIRGVAEQTQGRFAVRALADLALASGAYAEAESAYTRLIALNEGQPPQWRPLFGRAQAREGLGRWSEAKADYRAAHAIDTDEPTVLIGFARGMLRHGEGAQEALALMELAYRVDPRSPEILAGLGEAYLAVGRVEDAATILDQALRRTPGDARTAAALGDALWRLGDRRRARYMWSRALNRETDDTVRAALVEKLESGLAQAP